MAKRTELKDSVKTINRGIEIAIRPSATQAAALSNWMGVARMAWNWMLAEWNRMYSEWELQESLLALASGNATGLGPYKIAAVARALGLQAEWLKPELPAHSSKKDKRQWTWGLRITDGGAVLAAVEPQPRASGNLDCSALLSALAARRQQAADLAECRRAGYEEPTNPRAVRSSHLQDPELRAQKQQKIADKAGKRAARLLAPNPFPKPAVSIVHSRWVDWKNAQQDKKWLARMSDGGYPGCVTREVAQDLGRAWAAHWAGRGGRPVFAKRTPGSGSCRIEPDIEIGERRVTIIGGMSLRRLRRGGLPLGKFAKGSKDLPRSCFVTVRKTCGRYFLSVSMEFEAGTRAQVMGRRPHNPRTGLQLGMDTNGRLRNVAVVADAQGGNIQRFPEAIGMDGDVLAAAVARRKHRAACIGRRLTRRRGPVRLDPNGAVERGADGKPVRQEPSKRYMKELRRLQKMQLKAANSRRDMHHKISRAIVDTGASVVANQDICVRGMMGNRRVAMSMSEAAVSTLNTFVRYKMEEAGGALQMVDRWEPTSGVCHKCSARNDIGAGEWFVCSSCGARHHRDDNAAVRTAQLINKPGR